MDIAGQRTAVVENRFRDQRQQTNNINIAVPLKPSEILKAKTATIKGKNSIREM